AAARAEDRRLRAAGGLHAVDPPRRQPRAARRVRMPSRHLRQGGARDQARARARFPGHGELHALRGRGSGRRRGLLRLRDELRHRGRDDLARLQLRPRAAPGRVPRAPAVEAALPRDLPICTFDKAVRAIKLARERGFRVTANCTLYAGEDPDDVADFFDYAMSLGIEGVMISPGYSYDHAPRQDVFLGRRQSKQLFREIFKRGRQRSSKWHFNQSSLFLDFLAGNQSYQCTPWANPTYNIFGWQKPCYLLVDEGYASSFKELMETTDWEKYGTGRNPKCDNCMAHCGYEGTAVEDTLANPLKALSVFL